MCKSFSATSIALVVLAGTFLHAAEAPPDADALRADVDKILAAADLGKTVVAVRILDLGRPGSGDRPGVVYSARADLPLVPASTMKLLTTAACLDRLGPDWRLRTHVGRLPSPTAKGRFDLAVIGGGDPNFSGRLWGGDTVGAFRRWAAILKTRGAVAFERLVLDDTLFDRTLQHPNWPPDQRAEWYEAPVGALAVNDSCVDIHVAPGKVGEAARIWTEPPGGYAPVVGRILTVGDRKKHRFSLERRLTGAGGMQIRAAGSVWVAAAEMVENRTVADPTAAFAATLVHTLQAEGVTVAGPVVRGRLTSDDGQPVEAFACDLVHTSRLDTTVTVANKRSQGFYAECLLKLLGAYGPTPASDSLRPREGNWANGAAEVLRWMREAGIPDDGCVIDDGSGLSKENRLTPLAVTELLARMHTRFGRRFVETLAVAGRDGSLRKRMRNSPAEGRVFGKTGYVLGTSALSGYVETDSGRLLAYAILMNGFPYGQLWKCRLAQDKVCIRLVGY